ncbi:pyridoxamine 5'-phosphate oxidase family protein [Candidatus Pacearchaeota archaeon]|nr:pyridoxamine 5'-phosphate oxidase family protein [Candidatus Pacearchaeota archaeon]
MVNLKKLENKILILATSKNNKPHQIAVEVNKILGKQILITDNMMKETRKNILKNKNVSLIFWDNKGGFELRGIAQYHSSGKWFDFVKGLKENKGFKPKGAIVININKIKHLK